LPDPQQLWIFTDFRTNPRHNHHLYALMATGWPSLNRQLKCKSSGFCCKLAANCALLGYYYHSLHNNPRKCSSQQLTVYSPMQDKYYLKTSPSSCSNLLSRKASVCAEMTQDYQQCCGQFNCKSNYCWTETYLLLQYFYKASLSYKNVYAHFTKIGFTVLYYHSITQIICRI
jgi:hypothetical protein